ncbi:MAG: hypothetical protein AAFP09_07150 [Cyanobacteria bacterium J06607_10]
MVFATDFDPLDYAQHRKKAHPSANTSKALPPSTAQGGSAYQLSDAMLDANAEEILPLQRVAAPEPAEAFQTSRPKGRQSGAKSDIPLRLPVRPSLPVGLQLLNRIQHGSTILTGVLMTGALLVYGSTVYVDRSTDSALRQLDALQSESQQLTTANESIKQSLAEQAIREDSGLELHKAGDVMFVEPAPVRPSNEIEETEAKPLRPLGY